MGAVVRFTPRPPRPPSGGGHGPTVTAALRAEIEAGVQVALDAADHFIALLDRLDGDADLEDGADAEPSLGAPEGHTCQIVWLRGGDEDREIDRQPEARTPDRRAPEEGAGEPEGWHGGSAA